VKNTLLILAVSLFFNILLGTITAYIIERFNFRFKKVVVALFFVGMLVPTFVTEIARFKIINGLGLYGSPGAPILIYVASDLM
jgi:raffinose/stachyose/melibiose transport system permease protein